MVALNILSKYYREITLKQQIIYLCLFKDHSSTTITYEPILKKTVCHCCFIYLFFQPITILYINIILSYNTLHICRLVLVCSI